ncbi:MAG TPA: hypothetical protein VFC53_07035, partial [Dehalococcoidia bacterium]|nr:hypothetical protein [Dehalococcoidia bacterium]
MSVGAGIAIWLALVVASLVVIVFLSRRWGHDPFGWSLLAASMGPLALVALAGARQRESRAPAPVPGERADIVLACDGSAASVRAAEHVAAMGLPAPRVVVLAVLPVEAQPHDERALADVRARIEAMTG